MNALSLELAIFPQESSEVKYQVEFQLRNFIRVQRVRQSLKADQEEI